MTAVGAAGLPGGSFVSATGICIFGIGREPSVDLWLLRVTATTRARAQISLLLLKENSISRSREKEGKVTKVNNDKENPQENISFVFSPNFSLFLSLLESP